MNRVNFIFANVDHSKVTTGLLSDYGLQFAPPEYYNGSLLDSNYLDISIFKMLYAGMDNSIFNDNFTLPGQTAVFNNISSSDPVGDSPIPIASMCINYNCFKPDAYTGGLVTVLNDQIFDVAGKNPYDSRILFASTPIRLNYLSNSIQFVLKSSLYYTNTSKTISSISIDMGDETGFRTVNWDTPFLVAYSSKGTKVFTIKFSFTDGTVLQSHGKIIVNFSTQLKSATAYYITDPITNTFFANSDHSGGIVTV